MPDELSQIIDVIRSIGGVATISPDEDFYDAGVSSISALTLLMELESRYSVSIPDARFVTARTARQIHELVASLGAQNGSQANQGI